MARGLLKNAASIGGLLLQKSRWSVNGHPQMSRTFTEPWTLASFEDHFHVHGISGSEIVSEASDKHILADARTAVSLLADPTEEDIECLDKLAKALPTAPHRRF